MSGYNFHHTFFLTSAPDIHHITDMDGVEVAFAGRSNAGKSTALNALTNQKSLARTSKTPGRTQLINLFEVTEGKRLVDLPGYGYAKVPEATKRKWQRSLGEYLQKRQPLKGLVLLMDIRHPLKELDQNMLQWAIDVNLPTLILLTKADKLPHSAQIKQLELVRNIVKNQLEGKANQEVYVEKFSALKKVGIDKLTQQITTWFDSP